MKKIFFLLFFVFLFLIIFSHSASAETCNCVRTGYSYDDVTKKISYFCKAQNISCSNGGLCQCETLYSSNKSDPCNPGNCVAPPVVNRNPNCVNNCNTQCVYGGSWPGYTCKIESGPHGTQTCACYPPNQSSNYDLCQSNPDCLACTNAHNAWTAIGCIQTSNPQAFITWLLGAAIGLAGGIAVLLIIFGGFLIILSSGDPQRLQAGKDILTSAIVGLVVIIFAVFLLRIIGVEILKIPGFE